MPGAANAATARGDGRRPFTAAEEAIWLSERPGDPRIIALVCQLVGKADIDQLTDALRELIRSRPMLTAHPIAAKGLSRQRFWAPSPDRAPAAVTVDCGGAHAIAAMVERLRLSVENQAAGIAVGVVQNALGHAPDQLGDHVVLIVHHAVTDGMGALDLLRELLDLAANGPAGVTTAPIPSAAAAIPRRALVAGRWRAVRAPTRLARQSAAPGDAGFGYLMTGLTVAKPPGPATTNDVLVAATVLAVDQWNTGHGRQTGLITVHMPIGTRQPPARYSAVGNATGRTTFSVAAGRRDPWRLLQDVTAASSAAKAAGGTASSPAEAAVNALRWLPAALRGGLLRQAGRVAAPLLMPTVTVSNLGSVDGRLIDSAGGSLGVRSLHFLTTAGMPQGITVTAAKLNGTVHLGVSFALALLDGAAAESFLGLVTRNADQLCLAAPIPGPTA